MKKLALKSVLKELYEQDAVQAPEASSKPEEKGVVTSGDPVPGDAPPEKQAHIFDFDDTLGETDNPNGVMLYLDGYPAHKTAEEAQAWLTSKGLSGKDLLKGPSGQAIEKPEGKDGFAAYISSAGLAKLQTTYPREQTSVTPNEPKGEGEMVYIDFTPSSYVNPNTTKPIDSTINKLKQANSQGSDTMVITARASNKSEPGIDFSGKTRVPSNAEDMETFLAAQGASPTQGVLGVKGQNKGDQIVKKFFSGKPPEQQPDEIHFYDDLSKNTKEVDAALSGKVPAETFIYGPGEFAHGGADPSNPNKKVPAASEEVVKEYRLRKLNHMLREAKEEKLKRAIKRLINEEYEIVSINRWQVLAGMKKR